MNQATLDKVAALGKMYRDAGVSIYAFKRGSPTDSDAQLDYNFQMAKAIGAHHVTLELPTNPAATERMGAFGKKHGIYVGYHTHTHARFDSFDEGIRQSTHNMMNVDAGHYQAGNSTSVLPLLRRYPDRVASIHLKDRQNNEGPNMLWGQGDTNLIEILRTVRDEKEEKMVRGLVERHATQTGSARASKILKEWNLYRDRFRKVMPRFNAWHMGGYAPPGFLQLWHPHASGVTTYPEDHNGGDRTDVIDSE